MCLGMRVAVVLCEVWHHSIKDPIIDRSGGLVVKIHDFPGGKAIESMGEVEKGSHGDMKK